MFCSNKKLFQWKFTSWKNFIYNWAVLKIFVNFSQTVLMVGGNRKEPHHLAIACELNSFPCWENKTAFHSFHNWCHIIVHIRSVMYLPHHHTHITGKLFDLKMNELSYSTEFSILSMAFRFELCKKIANRFH